METVLTIQYQESSDRGRPWHLYVQGLKRSWVFFRKKPHLFFDLDA